MIERSIANGRIREFVTRFLRAITYLIPSWIGAAVFVFLTHQAWKDAWPPVAPFLLVSGLLVLLAGVGFALAGLSRKRIAALLDVRAGLKDRLSNALEFSARGERTPLMDLAVADAAETAAGLEYRRLLPSWTTGNGRRLLALIVLLPLLYVAAAVDLGALWGPGKPTTGPEAAANLPPELAGSGFRELPLGDELLPALTGLRGLINTWRDRLAELRERAQAAARQAMGEEEILPEAEVPAGEGPTAAQEQQGLALDHLPALRFDDRVHVSDLAAMGNVDTEIDEHMRTAFNQLDQQVLDEDPNITAVQAYVNQIRQEADSGRRAGDSLMLAAATAQNRGEDATGVFRNMAQGAQQQSFNEFLNQYSQHLQRVVERKREVNQQRQQDDANANSQRPLVSDQGQQVPADAEQRLVRITPEMARQLQLSPQAGQIVNPPPQGEGPAGAGRGGGTFRGSIKVKHLNQQGQGRQENLQGQVDQGRAPDQTFEDNQEDAVQSYNQLFQPFLDDARQTLNDASIPLAIRTYVQRYLQSISPEQAQQGSH